ncbi:hypothetical protein [Streptomyces sp. NPDC003077]|uniref:hypothetical protein n=1 Tax=Streptomyces sp. NPDC003077 TaxID=3154443 RepID=UPI0033B4F0C5
MRARKRMTGVAGASVLMLLAVGCGGGPSGTKAAPKASRSVAAAQPVRVETTSRPATWTDDKKQVHELRIAPKSLARGSEADFERVRLDDDLKGLVPYYLTFTYVNTGKEALHRASLGSEFAVVGADGEPGERMWLMSNPLATSSGLPDQCRKSGSETLAPGASAEACEIFMLAPKQAPTTVSYTDKDGEPVIWQAGDGKATGDTDGVLPAGKPTDGLWQDSHERTVTIKATPKSVKAGTVADLSHFKLSADEKKLVPYYVTVEYRNTGEHDLYPDMQDGVELRGAGGQQARKLLLIDIGGDGVTQCPESVPYKMVKPDATVVQCSIHMLPKSDRPAVVVFQGKGHGAQPITWHATEGE